MSDLSAGLTPAGMKWFSKESVAIRKTPTLCIMPTEEEDQYDAYLAPKRDTDSFKYGEALCGGTLEGRALPGRKDKRVPEDDEDSSNKCIMSDIGS
ncbi:MAG: hypothetical protein Q9173_003718 [Seirophora scorigena]